MIVRVVLTVAVTYGWSRQQLDVNNVFLNGFHSEEVYMEQPIGFKSPNSSQVCKLNRAIYGLKQAPQAWFERLTKTLVQFGFQTSRCDPSLFIHSHSGHCTYILVYVDDIIVTGISTARILALIEKLHPTFAL